ncbi:bifunctional ADP-dependent NAD(P)H-hydrate dehydratase/NAD(P)H-hydrate epimerase [soil metagenome]
MRPLLTPAQMAEADGETIKAGTPGVVLMDRAGRAVARAVARLAGGRYGRKAVVVCGKGNNGGDGFVTARALARSGMGVRCLIVYDPAATTGDPAVHLARMEAAGVHPEPFAAAVLAGADVVVDAVFGTGFRGPAGGGPGDALAALAACDAPVVAIDIPSGVDGTTGRVEGPAARAVVTVAMGAEKLGTALAPGAAFAGRVEVADIGIAVSEAAAHLAEVTDVAAVLPHRAPDSHKRSAGAVAILGGSAGMSGAVVLAARAALRAGAGYATAGVTRSVDQAVSALLPEVLSTTVVEGDILGPEALDGFAPVLERATSLALGPGLGQGESQRALVTRALAGVDVPLVLDADGLNVLAGHSEKLAGRHAPLVITPHPAEMARLLDSSVEEVQADRLGTAQAAAERLGCVVLLKGFRTVIADPHGRAVVNPTGGPELASAGTGDVLTGIVAALLAAGLGAFEAAWAAAYLHGSAGAISAADGPVGVLAWDVAEALPHALTRVASSG